MTAAENAAKMGGGRDAGRDRNGTVAEALDDAGDLAAVDTDIGERTVIERDQLGIGLRAPPPVCPGIFRGYEKTDDRHGRNSQRECCIAKMGIEQQESQQFDCITAMQKVSYSV